MTLKDIEKILGFKLCNSAYKYKTYFTNTQKGMIAENWTKQGFKVSKVDLEKQKITFERIEFKRTKVHIPDFLYRNNLDMEAVEEMEKFFLYFAKKWRLS